MKKQKLHLRNEHKPTKTVAADTFNNLFPILVDNYITHRSINNRLIKEQTDLAIFLRDNYPVPPEPKDLPKL